MKRGGSSDGEEGLTKKRRFAEEKEEDFVSFKEPQVACVNPTQKFVIAEYTSPPW